MNSSSRLVFQCLVVIAVMAVCHGRESPLLPPGEANWPITSYLGSFEESKDDQLAFTYIRDMVEEKKLTSAEEVKQFIEELRVTPGLDGIRHKGRYVYARDLVFHLARLADASTTTTTSKGTRRQLINLIETIYGSLEVMQESRQAPDHDLVLYNFLRHYSKIKFGKPLKDILAEYEREMAQFEPEIQAEFDNVISCHDKSGYSSSKNSEKDKFLRQLAARMDLYGGHFDAKCMTKVARAKYKLDSSIPEGYSKLDWFMSVHCIGLSNRFEDVLVSYNLLSLFKPDELKKQVSVPAKLLKLNEYRRLCNQLSGSKTRQQVVDNIRSQECSGLMDKAKDLVSWCR